MKQKKTLTFELKDIKGNVYHITNTDKGMDIEELKGKVVFIAFFGHRCPPCRMEIPGFIEYTKDEKYAKKSAILAMEVQGLQRKDVEQFAKDTGINYRLVPGEDNIDFINYIGYRTQWNNAIPFLVVLDQNGKVVNFGNGIVSPEELKSIVDELAPNEINDTNSTK
jgi:thiol-disulfide isomerase/thioredoxin